MKRNRLVYKHDFPRLIDKLENMIIIGAFYQKNDLWKQIYPVNWVSAGLGLEKH